MSCKLKRTAFIIYADFETTYCKDERIQPQVAVWGMQVCAYISTIKKVEKVENLAKGYSDSDYGYFWGVGIESFMKKLFTFRRKAIVYFHNGAKFDTHFIIKALPLLGYKPLPISPKKSERDIILKCSLRDNNFKIKEHDIRNNFTSTTTKGKLIMQLKVWGKRTNGRRKRPVCMVFRDTKLIFPGFSIKQMGETLGNISKGSFDYKKIIKYKTKEEVPKDLLIYLKKDVQILTEYTNKFIEQIGFYNLQMTAAGTAYYNFNKTLLNNKKIIKITKTTIRKNEKGRFLINNHLTQLQSGALARKISKILFPLKWLNDAQELRTAYRGGLTYANVDYICKKIDSVNCYDINSSYPSAMMENLLPYDEPLIDKPENSNYPLKVWKVKINWVENKTGIPFIYSEDEERSTYAKKLKNVDILLCSPVYNLFVKYYKGIYSSTVKYQFKAMQGKNIFEPFIGKWYQVKKTTKNIVEKHMAKIFLNSLYGKFGQNPDVKSYHYSDRWEPEHILNDVGFYLPIGMFITSYARAKIVKAVGDNVKDFIYCDTDSLWIKESKKNLFNVPISDKLGDWKLEHEKVEFMARRRKTYVFKEKGKMYAVASGFHIDDMKIGFKEMIEGFTVIQNQAVKINQEFGVWINSNYTKTLMPVWEDFKPIGSRVFNCENKEDFYNLK